MQAQLYVISQSLKPGETIDVSYNDMKEAARREHTGLDLLGHISEDEVVAFSKKIGANWGVDISYNPMGKEFTMYKPIKKMYKERSDFILS